MWCFILTLSFIFGLYGTSALCEVALLLRVMHGRRQRFSGTTLALPTYGYKPTGGCSGAR